jgi:hypothetical protein
MGDNKVTVKVLHNLALHHGHVHLYKPPFYPYTPTDRLSVALVFDSPCDRVERLLAIIWDQLGATDDPQAPWAKAYRAQSRRLNVGDVAVVGETAWAVDGVVDAPSGGWTPVTVAHDQIWSFPKLFPRMVDGCEITIANWCDDCTYSHVGPCPDEVDDIGGK